MSVSREQISRKTDRKSPFFRGKSQDNLSSFIGILGSMIVLTTGAAWVWKEVRDIKPQFSLVKITDTNIGRVPIDGYIPLTRDASERRKLAQGQ